MPIVTAQHCCVTVPHLCHCSSPVVRGGMSSCTSRPIRDGRDGNPVLTPRLADPLAPPLLLLLPRLLSRPAICTGCTTRRLPCVTTGSPALPDLFPPNATSPSKPLLTAQISALFLLSGAMPWNHDVLATKERRGLPLAGAGVLLLRAAGEREGKKERKRSTGG